MLKDKNSWITIALSLSVYVGLIQLLLFFERQAENPQLDTFLEGVWYSTVTIAAVGYGDYVPQTGYGKVVGYLFVLSSIFLYGFFVSKLTNYLADLNENKKMGFFGSKFENHTVILGWDHFSKAVADSLVGVGQKVVIVTTNKEEIDLIYEHFHHHTNVFVLFSEFDNFELLQKVQIDRSNIIFINGGDDAHNLVHLVNLKKEYPKVKFIVPLDNGDLKSTFISAGVTFPICKVDLSAKLLASYIFEPDVAELGEELMTNAQDDTGYDIKEYKVVKGNPYLNQSYIDSFFDLKKEHNTILLGISKLQADGSRMLHKNPETDIKIELNDYLLLICNGEKEDAIIDKFKTEEGVFH